MDALVKAAQAEGTLNVIALPPDWANYGAIISAFSAKYGIGINSAIPNGGSQDEVDAIKKLGNRGPDVVDVGMAVALKNVNLFTPYQVQTWGDIPASQKEATGLWFQDYGGYMSIGYDSAKVPTINSIQDLLGPKFKSAVALPGDALKSNQAVNSLMMASLANGGSLDDISKGVDFFHQLKKNGNWVATSAPAPPSSSAAPQSCSSGTTCRRRTARTCRPGRSICRPTRSSAVTTPRRSARPHHTRPPRGCGRSSCSPTRARTSTSKAARGPFAWPR
jgi:ABC-type Fe3+ transport system, periplasmic component